MGLFGFGKKKKGPDILDIREALFGDMPLQFWPQDQRSADFSPWSEFYAARKEAEAQNTAAAVSIWQAILNTPDLESRHYLQAWHFLRQFGVKPPPEDEKKILGVVFEVPMDDGLDLLAAYADMSARYYNFTGAGVIWEHPDDSLDPTIKELLDAAAGLAAKIGPFEEDRPPPPPNGAIRISLLTPSGLHFGQGPFSALQNDPIGAPTVNAGTQLMLRLTELGKSRAD